MNLRESLLRASRGELHVAPPCECNTQLARHAPATARATTTQPAPPLHSEARATVDATGVQPAVEAGATSQREKGELHVASTVGRNSQLSPLRAPRIAADLMVAIVRTCELRDDSARERDALIAESLALPLEAQADLLAHFRGEAARWARACGMESCLIEQGESR